MPLENFMGSDKTISPRATFKQIDSNDYDMKETDRVVYSPGNGNTVKLPPVGKMAGKMVVINKYSAAGTLTIDDAGDDGKFTSVTLEDADDNSAFLSDGVRWHGFVMHGSTAQEA